MPSEKHSPNELAEDRTHMAAVRTGMAADRTLMGWVRTGMSMITFGFTIYKILQEVQETTASLPRESTPRNVGLILIGVGTLSMIMGKIEYWHTLKELSQFIPFKIWRPSFIMALVMSFLGSLLFLGILIRMV